MTKMTRDRPLISIVEDDDSLRAALVGFVQSLGHRVSGFGSAEDLLADTEARHSACIVTDIQMPGLSGIELKQRLARAGCIAPIIMITARTERALHVEALAAGALCVLKKPFPAASLVACLERALAR